MTCKDCIHYEVCLMYDSPVNSENKANEQGTENCTHFKDKSKFIKLPCKEEQIVYTIEYGEVKKWYIDSFTKSKGWALWIYAKSNKNKCKYDSRCFSPYDFGVTVFNSKKEAEAMLRGLSK